ASPRRRSARNSRGHRSGWGLSWKGSRFRAPGRASSPVGRKDWGRFSACLWKGRPPLVARGAARPGWRDDPMTPEQYEQLWNIHDEALELPPERRDAFLDQRCAGDPELRA